MQSAQLRRRRDQDFRRTILLVHPHLVMCQISHIISGSYSCNGIWGYRAWASQILILCTRTIYYLPGTTMPPSSLKALTSIKACTRLLHLPQRYPTFQKIAQFYLTWLTTRTRRLLLPDTINPNALLQQIHWSHHPTWCYRILNRPRRITWDFRRPWR